MRDEFFSVVVVDADTRVQERMATSLRPWKAGTTPSTCLGRASGILRTFSSSCAYTVSIDDSSIQSADEKGSFPSTDAYIIPQMEPACLKWRIGRGLEVERRKRQRDESGDGEKEESFSFAGTKNLHAKRMEIRG